MDDTWLDDSTFARNMDAIMGEKLYNHDQKKMVQKVALNKEPEQKLTDIIDEVNGFYYKFAHGLKNLFGFVSYKNLLEYLDKI